MTSPQLSPTKYLTLAEGTVGYDVQGSGPLIVLVPGMGELRSSYRFLAPALAASGFTVATTDLRGHGDSDTTFSSYGDVETAGDIAALIRELGGPAVIVGNSMAGGAGVIVSADHPELVSGLVLLGAFVRNPQSSGFELAMFRAMMAPLWGARVWKMYMPTLYAGTKPTDFETYRSAVFASLRRPAYAKAFSLTTRQVDHVPAEAKLSSVTAPVLVIMGELDPDFKNPAEEARFTGEALNGEVILVPETGHYPQSQQPEVTASAILQFLQSPSEK